MTPVFLVQYGELTLKGGNRRSFESRLLSNMRHAFEGLPVAVELMYGRSVVSFKSAEAATEHTDEVMSRLKRVFGIATIVYAHPVETSIEAMSEKAVELMKKQADGSFVVRATRANKNVPFTSEEINREVGAAVVGDGGRTVDLHTPDHTVYIIVTDHGSYVGVERVRGAGGLPHGSSGRVLSLLSSGIDSPVSSYRMMKRGARVFYVHFHSYPMTSRASIENTQRLVEVLQQHQPGSKLLLAPLAEFQKKIVTDAPEKLRVILYRAAMLQVGEVLARRVKARALVTGESLGQVASQTLSNMTATAHGLSMPLLRPLIGMDKQEIISEAVGIGTYDISIQPYEDCCSLLLPKSVETHADLQEVIDAQAALPWNEMVRAVADQAEYLDC